MVVCQIITGYPSLQLVMIEFHMLCLALCSLSGLEEFGSLGMG